MPGPHFDRIVPLITLVILGLGVVFLLELNTNYLIVEPGAGFPSFSVAWLLIGVIMVLIGLGVELTARAEPKLYRSGWTTPVSLADRQMDLALPLWTLPVLTPVAMFAFFRLWSATLATSAYILVLIGTAVLLLVVLIAQHYLIVGDTATQRSARTIVLVVAYVLAFAIFSAVAFNRYRTLYAAALVFPSSLLLSATILRGRAAHVRLLAFVVALAITQVYWVFSYWPAPFWFNSVGLLLVLYMLTGIVQATFMHTEAIIPGDAGMARQAAIEYAVVGSIALVLLAGATIWVQQRNIDLLLP